MASSNYEICGGSIGDNGMQVEFIDLKARYKDEKKELDECFHRILSKGHLVLTEELKDLENNVCEYTGSKYCLGLNSGTDALMIALWALDIGKGDEVIIPAISFFATAGAVAHVGATPRFCEVTSDYNIDTLHAESLINERTKAIMPVHWAGKTADINDLQILCKKNDLILIEDSAQSMGASFNGRHPGTFGVAGGISCHPLKNLNGVGDAGMLLTSSEAVYEKARRYRNHGMVERDKAEIFGVNSRMDSLNAEIIKYRLTKLDEVVSKRNDNVKLYKELLQIDEVQYSSDAIGSNIDTQVMFIVTAERRDDLKEFLKKKGIETLVYYGTPLHLHEASRPFSKGRGSLPVSEKICSSVLALPHHQYLSDEQIQYVCENVKAFYAGS